MKLERRVSMRQTHVPRPETACNIDEVEHCHTAPPGWGGWGPDERDPALSTAPKSPRLLCTTLSDAVMPSGTFPEGITKTVVAVATSCRIRCCRFWRRRTGLCWRTRISRF